MRRRIEEEMRPETSGPPADRRLTDRLRDDIWVGVSGGRETSIPREEAPDRCPTCGQKTLATARILED